MVLGPENAPQRPKTMKKQNQRIDEIFQKSQRKSSHPPHIPHLIDFPSSPPFSSPSLPPPPIPTFPLPPLLPTPPPLHKLCSRLAPDRSQVIHLGNSGPPPFPSPPLLSTPRHFFRRSSSVGKCSCSMGVYDCWTGRELMEPTKTVIVTLAHRAAFSMRACAARFLHHRRHLCSSTREPLRRRWLKDFCTLFVNDGNEQGRAEAGSRGGSGASSSSSWRRCVDARPDGDAGADGTDSAPGSRPGCHLRGRGKRHADDHQVQ